MSDILGLTFDPANISEYQTSIAASSDIIDLAALQNVIDEVDLSVIAFATVQNAADSNDDTSLTFDLLADIIGLVDLDPANLSDYQAEIIALTSADIATVQALQTLITQVNDANDSVTMEGQVVANNISGAKVEFFMVDEDGTLGERVSISSTDIMTDAEGNYTALVKRTDTPVMVVATGGTYVDEATQLSIDMSGEAIRSVLTKVDVAETVVVTPITEIAVQMADGEFTPTKIAEHKRKVAEEFFGELDAELIHKVRPVKLDDETKVAEFKAQFGEAAFMKARDYRFVLSALSVDAGGMKPSQAVTSLAVDLKNAGALAETTRDRMFKSAKRMMKDYDVSGEAQNYGANLFKLSTTKRNSLETELEESNLAKGMPEEIELLETSNDLLGMVSEGHKSNYQTSFTLIKDGVRTPIGDPENFDVPTDGGTYVIETRFVDRNDPSNRFVDFTKFRQVEQKREFSLTLTDLNTDNTYGLVLNQISGSPLSVNVRNLSGFFVEVSNLDTSTPENLGNVLVKRAGMATFELFNRQENYFQLVTLMVYPPQSAPDLDWSFDANDDLLFSVNNQNADAIQANYQGESSVVSRNEILTVDRSQDKVIEWAVYRDGVRVSPIETVNLATVVDGLAEESLNARANDNGIADAALFAQFMDDSAAQVESSQLSEYRDFIINTAFDSTPSLTEIVTGFNNQQPSPEEALIAEVNGLMSSEDEAAWVEALTNELLSMSMPYGDYTAAYITVLKEQTQVNSIAEIQAQIDRANQGVWHIMSISNYAYMNDASALTETMLSEIIGLTYTASNLEAYRQAIADSLYTDIETLDALQTLLISVDNAPPSSESYAITGQAVANNIEGSTVRVFEYVNGVKGQDLTITPGVTDALGEYSLTMQASENPVIIEVAGGTYEDEATQSEMTLGAMSAAAQVITGDADVSITPLTNLAYALVAVNDDYTSIEQANAYISDIMLNSIEGSAILDVAPSGMDGIGTEAEKTYRSALIALSVFGAGQTIEDVTAQLVDLVSGQTFDPTIASNMFFNAKRFMRRYGLSAFTDFVPTFGLDVMTRAMLDNALASDPVLGYLPDLMQVNNGLINLTAEFGSVFPIADQIFYSTMDADGNPQFIYTGMLDMANYPDGVTLQIMRYVNNLIWVDMVMLLPSDNPVRASISLGDLENGTQALTATASNNQTVEVYNYTPHIVDFEEGKITVKQAGTARFLVYPEDNTWQDVVAFDVVMPSMAPSIEWQLNANGDLAVKTISGSGADVVLTYQGNAYTLTQNLVIALDRNASDFNTAEIEWGVFDDDGVRVSDLDSFVVAQALNTLSFDFVSTASANGDASNVSDTFFADIDGLTFDAANMAQYRFVLENHNASIADVNTLQSLLNQAHDSVTAFASVQSAASGSNADAVDETILNTILGLTFDSQYLEEYKTAIAGASSLDDVDALQALIDQVDLAMNNTGGGDGGTDGDGGDTGTPVIEMPVLTAECIQTLNTGVTYDRVGISPQDMSKLNDAAGVSNASNITIDDIRNAVFEDRHVYEEYLPFYREKIASRESYHMFNTQDVMEVVREVVNEHGFPDADCYVTEISNDPQISYQPNTDGAPANAYSFAAPAFGAVSVVSSEVNYTIVDDQALYSEGNFLTQDDLINTHHIEYNRFYELNTKFYFDSYNQAVDEMTLVEPMYLAFEPPTYMNDVEIRMVADTGSSVTLDILNRTPRNILNLKLTPVYADLTEHSQTLVIPGLTEAFTNTRVTVVKPTTNTHALMGFFPNLPNPLYNTHVDTFISVASDGPKPADEHDEHSKIITDFYKERFYNKHLLFKYMVNSRFIKDWYDEMLVSDGFVDKGLVSETSLDEFWRYQFAKNWNISISQFDESVQGVAGLASYSSGLMWLIDRPAPNDFLTDDFKIGTYGHEAGHLRLHGHDNTEAGGTWSAWLMHLYAQEVLAEPDALFNFPEKPTEVYRPSILSELDYEYVKHNNMTDEQVNGLYVPSQDKMYLFMSGMVRVVDHANRSLSDLARMESVFAQFPTDKALVFAFHINGRIVLVDDSESAHVYLASDLSKENTTAYWPIEGLAKIPAFTEAVSLDNEKTLLFTPLTKAVVKMEYKSAKLSKDLIVNKLHWDGQKVVKLADSTANYLLENWGNYNPFTVMDAHDAKYQVEVIDKQEQESIVKKHLDRIYQINENSIDLAYYKNGTLYLMKDGEFIDIPATGLIEDYFVTPSNLNNVANKRIEVAQAVPKELSLLMQAWTDDPSNAEGSVVGLFFNQAPAGHLAANLGQSLPDVYLSRQCVDKAKACFSEVALTDFEHAGVRFATALTMTEDDLGNPYQSMPVNIQDGENTYTAQLLVHVKAVADNSAQFMTLDDFNAQHLDLSEQSLHFWFTLPDGVTLTENAKFVDDYVEYQLYDKTSDSHLVSGYVYLNIVPEAAFVPERHVAIDDLDTPIVFDDDISTMTAFRGVFFGLNDEAYGPVMTDGVEDRNEGYTELTLPVVYADNGEQTMLKVRASNRFHDIILEFNSFFSSSSAVPWDAYDNPDRGGIFTVAREDNGHIDFSRGVVGDLTRQVKMTAYSDSMNTLIDSVSQSYLDFKLPLRYAIRRAPDVYYHLYPMIDLRGVVFIEQLNVKLQAGQTLTFDDLANAGASSAVNAVENINAYNAAFTTVGEISSKAQLNQLVSTVNTDVTARQQIVDFATNQTASNLTVEILNNIQGLVFDENNLATYIASINASTPEAVDTLDELQTLFRQADFQALQAQIDQGYLDFSAVDVFTGTLLQTGILSVAEVTLEGNTHALTSEQVQAWYPTGQSTYRCNGLGTQDHVHTLYILGGPDFTSTSYGCTTNYWSKNLDYVVNFAVANILDEGVFPIYEIAPPTRTAFSLNRRSYLGLQLASAESHTLYTVGVDYTLTPVMEVMNVDISKVTPFQVELSALTETTTYMALPSRIDVSGFTNMLSDQGITGGALAKDHVAELTELNVINDKLAANQQVTFADINLAYVPNINAEYEAEYVEYINQLDQIADLSSLILAIGTVNDSMASLDKVIAHATDANNNPLVFSDLEKLVAITGLNEDLRRFYISDIAQSSPTNIDSIDKIQAVIDGVNATYQVAYVSGALVANAIQGASVEVYALNPDGSHGDLLSIDPAISDENGLFLSKVLHHSDPVVFVAVGGQYTDEATQQIVDMTGKTLQLALPHSNALTTVSITPVTELAYQSMMGMYSAASVEQANVAMASHFFGQADASLITQFVPVDLTDTAEIDAYKAEHGDEAYEKARDHHFVLMGLSADAKGSDAVTAIAQLGMELMANGGQLSAERKAMIFRDAKRLMADETLNVDHQTPVGATVFNLDTTERQAIDTQMAQERVVRYLPAQYSFVPGDSLSPADLLDAFAADAFNVSTALKQLGVETPFTDSLNLTNVHDNALVITTLTDKNDPNRVLRDITVLNLVTQKTPVTVTLGDLTAANHHALSADQTNVGWRNLSPDLVSITGNEVTVLVDGVARIEMRHGNDAKVLAFDVRTPRTLPVVTWSFDQSTNTVTATSENGAGWSVKQAAVSYSLDQAVNFNADPLSLGSVDVAFDVDGIAYSPIDTIDLRTAVNQDALALWQDNLSNDQATTETLLNVMVGVSDTIRNSVFKDIYRSEMTTEHLATVDAFFDRLETVDTYAETLHDINEKITAGNTSSIDFSTLSSISSLENVLETNQSHYQAAMLSLTPPINSMSLQTAIENVNAAQSPFMAAARAAGHNNGVEALLNEDHALATELELIDLLEFAIDQGSADRSAFFVPMFEGVNSLNWTPTHDSITLASGYAGNHTLMVSNASDGGGSGAGLFIVGEQGDWRYGAMSQSLFRNTYDAGSMQLLNNAIDWMLKDDSPTKSINVLSVHLPDGYWFPHNDALRTWLNTHYNSRHSINAANSCDYEAMDACIDTYQPDLIVFGDEDVDLRGYGPVKEAVERAIEMNIPFIVTNYHRQPPAMIAALHTAMKMASEANEYTKHRISNFTVTDTFKTQDVSFDPVKSLLDVLRNDSFDTSVLNSCGNNYWNCTSGSFASAFKTGADKLKNVMIGLDATATDAFKANEPIAQAALLLGDKYREGIDYPIAPSEHNAFVEALYADWVVSYGRNNNPPQPDLGEHIVDTAEVLKNHNANYAHPDVIGSQTRTFAVDYDNQWTTTGWYALPGKPVTLTRHDADDSSVGEVRVKLYYARDGANRIHEHRQYVKPMFLTNERIVLNNGDTVTFSTPYGTPIYLKLSSSEGNRATTVTVSGAAHHPAVMDPNDPEDIDNFVRLINETEIPHFDYRNRGYEAHGRKDRYTLAINDDLPTAADLFESMQVDHIDSLYKHAGFSLPSKDKTLAESNSPFVMAVCNAVAGEDLCNDLNIHTRHFIQHANYDQYSQASLGTSGNPWDSSVEMDPEGWLDNHELGHNLQVNRLNIAYGTDTENWATYQSRATENSVNVFPYYVAWNFHYNRMKRDNIYYDDHTSGKRAFAFIMSDVVGLQNSNGRRVIVNESCEQASSGNTRHESMFAQDGYADFNWYRMQFYVQLMLRTQGMEFINGMENPWGYDIIPLLYLIQRSFGEVANNENTWNEQRANFGFEMFPYSGHSVYGGRTIRDIPGNDWLLVTLTYLTGYNWQSQFDLFGLITTSLATAQAEAHTTKGDLPMGLYVLETDLPPDSWTDGVDFLPMALDDSSTRWPRDGWTPYECPNLTYSVEPVNADVTQLDATTYQLSFSTPNNIALTVENLTPELIDLDVNNIATILDNGRAALQLTGDNVSQTFYFDARLPVDDFDLTFTTDPESGKVTLDTGDVQDLHYRIAGVERKVLGKLGIKPVDLLLGDVDFFYRTKEGLDFSVERTYDLSSYYEGDSEGALQLVRVIGGPIPGRNNTVEVADIETYWGVDQGTEYCLGVSLRLKVLVHGRWRVVHINLITQGVMTAREPITTGTAVRSTK
ncbi:hypothetical protein UB34_19325 [Photobacterium leiognathi]|nr:hypothetical protein UB34_19325 [Photobacterium leiognathi]